MSWEERRFESLYLIPSKNGLTRPTRVRGNGFKMINMKEIFAYDRIKDIRMELVPMNEQEIQKYNVKKNDLLFARQSLVLEGAGKCSIVLEAPQITTFESHLIRIRLNGVLANPMFYYYYFSSTIGKANIQTLVMQVAAAGIRGSELAKLPIPYPPISTQTKIASILSAYDDLIENNTRRIQILEQMAQTIYKEWFVNFRFPGHENTKFVDSPLGKIPEGWEVKKLGEVLNLEYGKGLKKENRVEGIFPVYGSSGIIGFHNEFIVKAPNVVVGRKGNVGSIFLASKDFYPIDTTYYVKSELDYYYVYYLLSNQKYHNNDAAVPGLNRSAAHSIQFVLPVTTLINEFGRIIDSFYSQIENLESKVNNLRRTRDLLLPKLMSGEVEV